MEDPSVNRSRMITGQDLACRGSPNSRLVSSNRSFDTDAQVLQCASRTRLPGAGQLQR